MSNTASELGTCPFCELTVPAGATLIEYEVEGETRLFAECDLRVSEDRAGLIVERAVAILTQMPLKLPIAAVSDRSVRRAVGTSHTVTPADLL